MHVRGGTKASKTGQEILPRINADQDKTKETNDPGPLSALLPAKQNVRVIACLLVLHSERILVLCSDHTTLEEILALLEINVEASDMTFSEIKPGNKKIRK